MGWGEYCILICNPIVCLYAISVTDPCCRMVFVVHRPPGTNLTGSVQGFLALLLLFQTVKPAGSRGADP